MNILGLNKLHPPFLIQTIKLRPSAEGGSTLRKTYKIEPGDTLYSIAKKFDTTWQILFELNKDTIKKPDEILPGRYVKLPPKGSSLTGKTNDEPDSLKSQTNYTVKKDETLSGISRRSGVSVGELKRLNGISEPRTLQAGQTIKLRGSGSEKPQASSKPAPAPVATPKPTTSSSSDKEEGFFDDAIGTMTDIAKGTAGVIGGAVGSIGDGLGVLSEKAKEGFEGIADAMSGGENDKITGQKTGLGNKTQSASGTYTVKRGDTLIGIAQKHGINTNNLARANNLKLTDTIRPGDRLTIPKGGSSNNSSTSSNSSSQSSKVNNPIEVTTTPGNSTNGTPKEVATTNGACICKAHDLIWGAKVDCDFRKKVIEISQDLWPDDYLAMANNLMACIYFESAKTFSPKIDNGIGKDEDGYGYVGLIQFGNDACKDLNIKKKQLVKMSAVEQLEWVKKYFLLRERNKLITDLVGMYMCINYPKNLVENRMKPNDVVYTSDKKAYKQNPSFFKEDGERDRTETIIKNGKKITKYLGFENGKTYIWEVAEEMQNYYKPGEKRENRSFISTCDQVVQPPATNNKTSSLIDRAKAGKRYVKIPNNYWILGERANINRPNKFDDMIHLMLGEKLIKSIKGTTHPGVQSLTNPDAYNSARTGSPVWDFGWHYGVWSKGRHRGRIDAFAHTGVAYINRDTNKNNVPDNSGASRPETGKGLNFHPASYTPTGSSSTIGTWSTGCVVAQSATDYYQIFNTIIKSGQNKLTFCVVAGDI